MQNGMWLKGMAIGLMVGVGVYYLVADSSKSSRRRLKRKANKALQGARCFCEDMAELMHI